MTQREIDITRAILKVLHDLDGGQLEELPLHADTNNIVKCSLGEFNAALNICNGSGWLTGVPSRFKKGMLWSINTRGEAALLEMN